MCEGVGEDSRHRAWHVDIHVEMCMFYLNVCECVNMALQRSFFFSFNNGHEQCS